MGAMDTTIKVEEKALGLLAQGKGGGAFAGRETTGDGHGSGLRLGGGLDRALLTAKNRPWNAGTEFLAKDACEFLDSRSVLGWDAGSSPSVDHGMACDRYVPSELRDAAVQPYRTVKGRFGDVFHARNSR